MTGAGAGLGRGIVKKATAEGARVLAVDINQQGVEETAAAAPKGTCVAHANDGTVEENWRAIKDAAVSAFGKFDVVVNCAGVVHIAGASHEIAEDQYDMVFKYVCCSRNAALTN